MNRFLRPINIASVIVAGIAVAILSLAEVSGALVNIKKDVSYLLCPFSEMFCDGRGSPKDALMGEGSGDPKTETTQEQHPDESTLDDDTTKKNILITSPDDQKRPASSPGSLRNEANRAARAAAADAREKGSEAFENNDIDGALAQYHEAVNLDPDNPDAFYELGRVYRKENDPVEAQKQFEKFDNLVGTAYHPLAIDALSQLASLAGSDHATASYYYKKALNRAWDLNDTEAQATLTGKLGDIAFSNNERNEAIEFYKDAELMAATISDDEMRAEYLDKLGQVASNAKEAIGYYKQALISLHYLDDEYEHKYSLYEKIAQIALNNEDVGVARSSYEEAVTLTRVRANPERRTVYLHRLGEIALKGNKPGAAKTHYDEALKLTQANSDKRGQVVSLVGLSSVAEKQSKFQDAARLAEKAIKIEGKKGRADVQAIYLRALKALAANRDSVGGIEKIYNPARTFARGVHREDLQAALLRDLGIRIQDMNINHALDLLTDAQELFKDAGDKNNAANVGARIERLRRSQLAHPPVHSEIVCLDSVYPYQHSYPFDGTAKFRKGFCFFP